MRSIIPARPGQTDCIRTGQRPARDAGDYVLPLRLALRLR
jgi:hypothetical protein